MNQIVSPVQLRIFELFKAQDAEIKAYKSVDCIPQSVLCRPPLWDRCMDFAVNAYLIEKPHPHQGQHLACGSVKNLLSALLQRTKEQFRHSMCAAAYHAPM